MKLAKIGIAAILVIAVLAVGLFVAKGPQPEIIVPAEVLTKVGPLNITNTLLTAWVVMAFLIVLSLLATRSMKMMPSGVQNFMEAAVGFLLAQIEDVAGEKNARRFFAVAATIFLFIITSNWFGLLPFFNAIGKTEDVGHEIFHEIEVHAEKGEAFKEAEHFAGWLVDGDRNLVFAKPNADDAEFEIPAGTGAGEALDHYIVFLAQTFAGYKRVEGASPEIVLPEEVREAADILSRTADVPKLLFAEDGDHAEGEEGEHGVTSPALGRPITGVSFEDGQKFALIIPFFRSVYSDLNNTLALGIIAFLAIEFWGIQALGAGYLKKFFNLNGIMSFVGILELLSEFIRIISFTFRLFGNIFAGEVLILMLTFLMPFLVVDVIYGLEIFVGFIQAAVFALLVVVFGSMAVESHDEHDEAHHDAPAPDGRPDQGVAQAH